MHFFIYPVKIIYFFRKMLKQSDARKRYIYIIAISKLNVISSYLVELEAGEGMNRVIIAVSILVWYAGAQATEKVHRDKQLKYLGDATQENISFPVRENVLSQKTYVRRGILIKRPKAKATVLICHGYMCDKYDVSFLHIMFKEYNSMKF